ncbi:hypothetical protein [Kocuria rhizosphaericola]|uniref:hypothetical protein n=1 Tax=Kocuria rhizosphaericola TaxID=3376284 RepID=UPI00379DA971
MKPGWIQVMEQRLRHAFHPNTGEITVVVSFLALIVVRSVLTYGHRFVARRPVNGPQKRPQRRVDFAAFRLLTVLATAFPLRLVVAVARAEGRLHGKQPMLSPLLRRHLMALHAQGEHSRAEPAELSGAARSTICRTVLREASEPPGGVPGRGQAPR